MKRTTRFLTFVLTATMAVALIAATANAKVVRWKMTSTWPPSINLIDCDKMFVETVNTLCKGRLEIKFFNGGTLMPSFEVFDAVSRGTIEASGDWPNYWSGKDTTFDSLGSYPMGLTPFDYLVWYHYGGGKAIYEEAYGKFGMMYIVTGMTTMESGIRSNKPIKSLEDLKGMKIRMSGKTQGKILQDLGAAQVAMAGQEIYQALQKGVVDAAEFSSPSTDWGMGFQEVTKYWAVPGWHQPASTLGVMINKKAWDALDEDLKQMIQYAAYSTQIRFISKQYFDTIEYVQKFKDKGIVINRYEPEVLDRIEILTKKHCEETARENPLFKKSMQSQIKFRKGLAAWREMEEPFSFGFNPKVYPELD